MIKNFLPIGRQQYDIFHIVLANVLIKQKVILVLRKEVLLHDVLKKIIFEEKGNTRKISSVQNLLSFLKKGDMVQ